MDTRFAVVIGLDVGKTAHHACALDPDGNKLFDKPLPQDETKLRELFSQLQNHGEVHAGFTPTASAATSSPPPR